MLTKVEFGRAIVPEIFTGRGVFFLLNLDFIGVVVCPYSAVSAADGTLALVERFLWRAWDSDGDGAAVA